MQDVGGKLAEGIFVWRGREGVYQFEDKDGVSLDVTKHVCDSRSDMFNGTGFRNSLQGTRDSVFGTLRQDLMNKVVQAPIPKRQSVEDHGLASGKDDPDKGDVVPDEGDDNDGDDVSNCCSGGDSDSDQDFQFSGRNHTDGGDEKRRKPGVVVAAKRKAEKSIGQVGKRNTASVNPKFV